MTQWIRNILLVFLSALLLFGAGRLYFFATDGFTINNITSEFAFRDGWRHPYVSEKEEREALRHLNQKYTYLGRGAQAYAFLSEDGNYVLKIIKQKHLKLMPWEDVLLSIPLTQEWRQKKIAKRGGKVRNVLRSSAISYEELRNETALLYLHLRKTDHLNTSITITDKMGFEHTINLDEMEFLLQRRAILALPYLESLVDSGEIEKAERALDRMIALRVDISKRGIVDQDTGFLNNMGFVDDEAVIIDIGQFAKSESIMKVENYRQDLLRKTAILHRWLQENHPPLALYLTERLP